MESVSVVLNGFRRPHTLKEQLEALKYQSRPVKEILYWQNTHPGVEYDQVSINKTHNSISSQNFGVWSRFAYALNCSSDYVLILDDDTIPAPNWIDNCFETHKTHPGLLGGVGLRFADKGYNLDTTEDGIRKRYGWCNEPGIVGNNEEVIEVDIVGHSWFFKKDLLCTFWRELPQNDWLLVAGEDIHFSAMVQKYTDMKTYVPPHPKNDRSMWSSTRGSELGSDDVATWRVYGTPHMANALTYYVDNGFELIKDR